MSSKESGKLCLMNRNVYSEKYFSNLGALMIPSLYPQCGHSGDLWISILCVISPGQRNVFFSKIILP